jgi:F-type H+-transporting ATPase subunit epsilon
MGHNTMAITTHVNIVSAEREIFSGIAEMLVATGELGEIGVVHGHAPLLTKLKPGEVRLTLPGGKIDIYYISGGILEVQAGTVTVLADSVERAEDLDEILAEEARQNAMKAMAEKGADFDYSVAATELARAVAQIRAIQKVRKSI